MPDGMQVSNVEGSVEAAEDAVVNPYHNCADEDHRRADAQLVHPRVLMLHSVQLFVKQVEGRKRQAHQRKSVDGWIPD